METNQNSEELNENPINITGEEGTFVYQYISIPNKEWFDKIYKKGKHTKMKQVEICFLIDGIKHEISRQELKNFLEFRNE